ncbi:hypothetical protein HGG75_26450 [Ochrobactrum pseudogrignonense]|nr:hypothetical protein [Brucella pseudogrignonensis]
MKQGIVNIAPITVFIKQRPSPQIFFENPMVCGECDVEIYESLSLSRIEEIQTFATNALASTICGPVMPYPLRNNDRHAHIGRILMQSLRSLRALSTTATSKTVRISCFRPLMTKPL